MSHWINDYIVSVIVSSTTYAADNYHDYNKKKCDHASKAEDGYKIDNTVAIIMGRIVTTWVRWHFYAEKKNITEKEHLLFR